MEKIKFLGIGSAFNPLWGNNAAYYKKNNSLLLIDCGETNFERILRFNLLNNIKNINVLITHLHPDHIGSLGSLIFYCKFMLKVKLNVIFKDKDNIKRLLELMGVQSEDYNLLDFVNSSDLDIMDIKGIESINIEHSKNLKSYGYKIIFNDNEIIMYTGDCKNLSGDIVNEVIENKISKLYIDSFPFESEGVPHITINKLCEIFPKECRNRIYGMHYDGEEIIKLLRENNFKTISVEKVK